MRAVALIHDHRHYLSIDRYDKIKRMKKHIGEILSVLLATSFGLASHSAFVNNNVLIVMTLSFIFILPFGIGALTIWPVMNDPTLTWAKAIFRPWGPSTLFIATLVTLDLEAFVCVLLASPIVFLFASIGGAIIYAIKQAKHEAANLSLLVFLVSPFVLAPLEEQFKTPTQATTTQVSIEINASPADVWNQIGHVPDLTAEQDSVALRLTDWVNIPRPIKAEMGEIELGAERIATFEGGLQFREVVTDMTFEHSVTYSIEAINRELLPEPLNQIDGEYLDLKSARYEIEPLADGTVRLHLISEHTLTTKFNWYGAFWTQVLMADFQRNLLQVIKVRAEN